MESLHAELIYLVSRIYPRVILFLRSRKSKMAVSIHLFSRNTFHFERLVLRVTVGPFEMNYNIEPRYDQYKLDQLYQFIDDIDEGAEGAYYQIDSDDSAYQELLFNEDGLLLKAFANDSLGTGYSILMREESVYREFLRQFVTIFEQAFETP